MSDAIRKAGGAAHGNGNGDGLSRLLLTTREIWLVEEGELGVDDGNGSRPLVRTEDMSATASAELRERLNMISAAQRRGKKLDEFVSAANLVAKYFGEHGLRVQFKTKLDRMIDAKGEEVVPLEIVDPIIDALNQARRSIWTGFKMSVHLRDISRIPSSAIMNAVTEMSRGGRKKIFPQEAFLKSVTYAYAHGHDDVDDGGNGKGAGSTPTTEDPDQIDAAMWKAKLTMKLMTAIDNGMLGVPSIPSVSAQMVFQPSMVKVTL